jgi:hypothetical protein
MKAHQAEILVALAFAAALVGALWIIDYLPTGDGPNHALTGYLTVALHDPAKGYDAFLTPGHPRSSLFFHGIYAAFLRVLPWQPAQQLTLTLGALLWAFGLGSVATALHPKRAAVGLFGFATAFSWTFYVGLFSYWMTLGAGLALLGLVLRRRALGLHHRALLAFALVLMVFAHSFAAMLMGALLGILVLVRGGERGRVRELGLLALTGLPAVALAYLSARGAARLVDPVPGADPLGMEWLPLYERLHILWACFTGGPRWRGAIPLAAALAGLGALVARARRASREEIAVGAMAAALILAVLLTPIHVSMWQVFSPRFLPWGLALAICLLPVEELPGRGPRLAAVGIGAFALASIAWAGVHHVTLARKHADVLALAAEPIHRKGARLPLGLVPSEGSAIQVDDVSNFGQIFAVEQGGMTPYLFAARPELHPFVWRKPARELFPPYPSKFFGQALLEPGATRAPRAVHLAQLAQMGSSGWEDVILWGLPGDVEAFLERGYEADARKGDAALLRYRPCGLTVDIDAGEALAEPLIAQIGWAPLIEPSAAQTFPEGATRGRLTARFADAPCGPVWVRVAWDRDRNGKPSKADRFCQGADVNGRTHALLTRRGPAVVRCE